LLSHECLPRCRASRRVAVASPVGDDAWLSCRFVMCACTRRSRGHIVRTLRGRKLGEQADPSGGTPPSIRSIWFGKLSRQALRTSCPSVLPPSARGQAWPTMSYLSALFEPLALRGIPLRGHLTCRSDQIQMIQAIQWTQVTLELANTFGLCPGLLCFSVRRP
jgi:hypothetical protein